MTRTSTRWRGARLGNLVEVPDAHSRILAEARGDRRSDREGLATHGRPGLHRRRGFPLHRRPPQGHDPSCRRDVYSAEVESAIYETPSVCEAAVFGLPDERLGEEVACVIMLKKGKHLSKAELHSRPRVATGQLKIPTRVSFTNEHIAPNPAGSSSSARCQGSTSVSWKRLPRARSRRRWSVDVGEIEPRGVVRGAVDLVTQFATGELHGEEDSHGVDSDRRCRGSSRRS